VTRPVLAVIKIGGSLFNWPELPVRLEAFLGDHFPMTGVERPLLIAGGGPAADLVRDLDRIHRLGDAKAHHLALHAMDLSAFMLSTLIPGTVSIDSLDAVWRALAHRKVPILAPRRTIHAIDDSPRDPLPANWDVTSDTIAAWIAAHVKGSRLILLKSAPLGGHASLRKAARAGLVDPVFPDAAKSLNRVEYLNLRDPTERLEVLPP
jgi:5-(aminomethyl)-3-furanmethanol phosphate kinase